MKICLIAEGSYPFITGGVSSWIHSLISQMPEHEFIIFAIGASRAQSGKYKYKLPANVIQVKEMFLDSYLDEEGQWGKRFRLTSQQRQSIQMLLGNGDEETINWPSLFNMLRSGKFRNAADFLTSKDYFDLLEELCMQRYRLVPFTEMFWTVRSMILPLFLTIREDIPEADVYHSASTGYAGVVGALAKHLYNKPFILTEHGIYSREREEEIIKADWVKGYFKDLWIEYFYRLSACAYDAADQVVTLFNRNKEIQIELGCDPDKISIIPNGVNIEDYAMIQERMEDDSIQIGAIVRVVPIKDIKTMLQSFALIKQEVPNAKFYIMGPYEEDPDYYEECIQLQHALGLEDVEFTGSVRIQDYLGKMDILMLTSISEGQPLAILEGMAVSKPFVATNVGSCAELLKGLDDGIGEAGFVVPVMHYEQLAQAAIRLCKDRQLREVMGQRALERVRKYYRQDDVIKNYRTLYRQWEGKAVGGNRV